MLSILPYWLCCNKKQTWMSWMSRWIMVCQPIQLGSFQMFRIHKHTPLSLALQFLAQLFARRKLFFVCSLCAQHSRVMSFITWQTTIPFSSAEYVFQRNLQLIALRFKSYTHTLQMCIYALECEWFGLASLCLHHRINRWMKYRLYINVEAAHRWHY